VLIGGAKSTRPLSGGLTWAVDAGATARLGILMERTSDELLARVGDETIAIAVRVFEPSNSAG
jgi:hypothetical protein